VFGPLLLIGASGIYAELLDDSACRSLPVSRRDIRAMLREVRAFRVFRGHRGTPPADVEAVTRAALAVARLADSLGGRLRELDVNPLAVLPRGRGTVALDAPGARSVARGARAFGSETEARS
jgi:acyl-CoA synthetase (NDP forming)